MDFGGAECPIVADGRLALADERANGRYKPALDQGLRIVEEMLSVSSPGGPGIHSRGLLGGNRNFRPGQATVSVPLAELAEVIVTGREANP